IEVVDLLEDAEKHGVTLDSGMGVRSQVTVTNLLLTKYITQWSLVGDDGKPLPIGLDSLRRLPIGVFTRLSVAVAPALAEILGAETEPGPLAGAGSSTTPPTG